MAEQEPAEMAWILEGPALGEVAMEDVAKFLVGIVKAVELGCGHAVGREVKATGRREAVVERARRIRLSTIESGSVAVHGRAASSTPEPGLLETLRLEAESVSERGMGIAFDAAGNLADLYPDVARAWGELAADVGVGKRHASIRIEDLRPAYHRRVIVIDNVASQRLRGIGVAATLRDMNRDITGRIFEADLENHTAKVRTPSGELVAVTFDETLSADIERRFGHRAELRGELTFDPVTQRGKSLRVREVTRGEQLSLGSVDFWGDQTVQELRQGRGMVGVADVDWVRLDLTPQERADLLDLVAADA